MTRSEPSASVVRLACVGDSITQGAGLTSPYPTQLSQMLGPGWDTRNFGVSGSTLLNQGDMPYQKEAAFQSALDFRPNVVVIKLGTNDTKPQNWQFQDCFLADYRELITQFRAAGATRLLLCSPALVTGENPFLIREEIVLQQIPLVQNLAREEGAEWVDLHDIFHGHEEFLPDTVHPDDQGAELIARAIHAQLLR